MSDIARDLRDLVKEMCPHPEPDQVGTQIRQEAYDLVERLWKAKIVTSWKNYRLVVEDHADHRACGEGEEAMPFDVVSDSGSDDDDDHSDSGDDTAGGDDDDSGGDSGGQGYEPQKHGLKKKVFRDVSTFKL